MSFAQAFLDKHLNIHDTCGVHNLHGMPGIIGGIVGAITAANANADTYGYNGYVMSSTKDVLSYPISYKLFVYRLFNIWGAMAPKANSTEFVRLQSLGMTGLQGGNGYSAKQMAGYQIAAVFVTLGVSLIGGVITGM